MLDEKKCPKCGAEVDGDECEYCGTKLDSKECSRCGASVEGDECEYCGTKLDSKDCPNCGAPVEGDECEYCGTNLEKGNCPDCGAPMKGDTCEYCGSSSKKKGDKLMESSLRHNLWDRMMYRLLQEKKEKEVKASKSKGAKPDFLDLDKDGDKEEPMSKASKEAGGKKDTPKAKKGKGKIPPQLRMHIQKKKAKKSKIDEAIERLEKILIEGLDEEKDDTALKEEKLEEIVGPFIRGGLEWVKRKAIDYATEKAIEKGAESVTGGDEDEGKGEEPSADSSDDSDEEKKKEKKKKKKKQKGGDKNPFTYFEPSPEPKDKGDKDSGFTSSNFKYFEPGKNENYSDWLKGQLKIEEKKEILNNLKSLLEEYLSVREITDDDDDDDLEESVEYLSEAEVKKKQPKLGKVTRNPAGSNKKFHVYVKCGGRVKKISFGDPGLSIKRDSAARRKNFRARHKCDKPAGKDRCTARYWSCYQWRAGKKVEGEE